MVNNKTNNNTLFALLIVAILLNISVLVTKSLTNNKKYIIFDKNNAFYLKNNNYDKMTKEEIGQHALTKMNIYYQSYNYSDIYYIQNSYNNIITYSNKEEFNAFYDENINPNHEKFMLTNINKNLTISELEEDTLNSNEKSLIESYLKSKNVKSSLDELEIRKLDNVYEIQGDSSSNENLDKYISLIFSIVDNNIKIIDEKIGEKDNYLKTFHPFVYLTFNYKGNNNIVINNSSFGQPDKEYMCIYTYDQKQNEYMLISSDCGVDNND